MIYPPEVQEFLEKYDRILLDPQGILKLQSADFYKTLDNTDLRVWCICRAIYQLPTVELIEWLKSNFNLDKAIEIGAGNNYLYHHLGIKGVDNYSEQIPAVKLVHDILHEPSTNPPPEVENLDAIAAIKKYQPETVITSWMTLKTNDPEGIDAGHKYAPDEREILDTDVTYIHIGNEDIHSDRLIMAKPHETYYFGWLVSRGKHPEQNCIYVWQVES
ncbi:hypothetical protein NIES4102_41450 (plasmid) [Chondrocystis sp. NIES-4102]|nr:hypothetical protein NIES4102_41450 [Chondrocystis sp. NIES-4102]